MCIKQANNVLSKQQACEGCKYEYQISLGHLPSTCYCSVHEAAGLFICKHRHVESNTIKNKWSLPCPQTAPCSPPELPGCLRSKQRQRCGTAAAAWPSLLPSFNRFVTKTGKSWSYPVFIQKIQFYLNIRLQLLKFRFLVVEADLCFRYFLLIGFWILACCIVLKVCAVCIIFNPGKAWIIFS